MSTAKDIMTLAAKYVGVKESPANSNNVIFNTHYYGREVNGSAYAWCCSFIWDIFRMASASNLFYNGSKTAYCPAVQDWGKAQQVSRDAGRYGDIILFDWNKNGSADHIGLIESKSGNTYTTIEGNTAIGNDSNGGEVMRRQRPIDGSVLMVIRPKYASESTVSFGGGMKYNAKNPPLACMMRQSNGYTSNTEMSVKGVLWHSTGANNPNVKRYVQPDDDAPDRAELLKKLGVNAYKNDWNHVAQNKWVNGWIGKLADGTVSAVQVLPWDYTPKGCGSGSKGSCNNGWIQFEICEDSLTDKAYFEAVYREACELTAYLCTLYNLDPMGKVSYAGQSVPVILCHHDSYKLGLGSGHVDVDHWFGKYGKTMDDARRDVAALMGKTAPAEKPAEVTLPTFTATLPKLSKGCEGIAVKNLQRLLIANGFFCGKTGADGDFGNATLAALKEFQKANNLTVDGVAGAQTFGALFPIIS